MLLLMFPLLTVLFACTRFVLVLVRLSTCTLLFTLTPAGAATPRTGGCAARAVGSEIVAGRGVAPSAAEPSCAVTAVAVAVTFGADCELAGGGAPCRRTSTATPSARPSHAALSPSAAAVNSKYSREPSLRAHRRNRRRAGRKTAPSAAAGKHGKR